MINAHPSVRWFNIVSLLLLLSTYAYSFGNLSISGRVINDEDGSGIPGVHIFIEGSKYETVTNTEGYFELSGLIPGHYILTVKSMGFESQTLSIDFNESQIDLALRLKESFKVLKGLTIESTSITGGEGELFKIPGSAHVITPGELEKFSYNDVMQILRNVPGVNLQEEDGFGLRPNIGLRGTGVERSSKITVMEDGVLIAPAPYVAPAAYYFPTSGRMEGVEVRKGSSQIQYGPYTTGGALNLLSTSIPHDFMARLHVFGGSYGSRNMHAFAGDASEKLGFLVETYQAASDGFKQLDNTGKTGFKTEDYLFKFRFNSKEEADIYQALTVSAGVYKETSFETYLGITDDDFYKTPLRRYFGSQNDIMNADQKKIFLTHLIKPSKNLSFNTTLYGTSFSRNWYKLDKVRNSDASSYVGISDILEEPEIFFQELNILKGSQSSDDALTLKANNRSYFSRGIQSRGNWISNNETHHLSLGLRVHTDQIDRYQWVDAYSMNSGVMMLTTAGQPGTESNRIETANAYAGFLLYQLHLEKLKVIPGLRYENIQMERKDFGTSDPDRTGINLKYRNNNVSVWIPGIGLEYLVSKYWNLFGGIHKGFSPPGTKEGTNPEISINYEAGFRLNKNNLNLSTTFFYNNYENLLGVDLASSGGTGSGDLFNGGEALSRGIEFGLQYIYMSNPYSHFSFPISVAYTFTNAEFVNDFESEFDSWGSVKAGDKLPYLSENQLVFNAGIENTKYQFNISSKYSSPMRTIAGQGEMAPDEKTDPAFTIDISGQYNISNRFGIFSSIRNITNNVYIVSRRPAGVRPSLPRTLTLGIKGNF